MNMTVLDSALTDEEFLLIHEIALRAETIRYDAEIIEDALTITHTSGTPLRLIELLVASEYDFIHDISGILQHLDRDTRQLDDVFVPRYAV
jgi:hypothetical protein